MLSLKEKKKAHFVGIGGVSTSALAKLLLSYGWSVTGSDRAYSERLTELSELGCRVWVGEDAGSVGLPDLAVYSGAARYDNPELAFCRCLGIPVYERGAFLGAIAENFGCTIAIAGTHGKTTVTAMTTHLFHTAKREFCAHVGGDAVGYGNFFRTGDRYFVTEACEYRRSMLYLRPDLGVVLNVENDHPDTYRNLTELYDAFDDYLDKSRLKVLCGDTPYYRLRQCRNDVVTYGFSPENRFVAENVVLQNNGCYGFSISEYGNLLCDIELNVPGRHNVLNALSSFVIGRLTGADISMLVEGLATYRGTRRRYETAGLFFGATLVSDYAHHPDEILAAVATARERTKKGRILAVFQPHTYSRTARLFNEFCSCFTGCDEVILVKEYPARETPDNGKTAKELFEGVKNPHKKYCDTLVDAAAYLQKNVAPGDTVLILGAGDVALLVDLLK